MWGNLFLMDPCRTLVPMRSARARKNLCAFKAYREVLPWECMHFLESGVAEDS